MYILTQGAETLCVTRVLWQTSRGYTLQEMLASIEGKMGLSRSDLHSCIPSATLQESNFFLKKYTDFV